MAQQVSAIMTPAPVAVRPGQPVADAARIMRERGVRRVPVVSEGSPVGILSIGDMAVELDSRSALADVSAQPPNI